MHKCISIDELQFPYIDDPELDSYIRQEIGKLWGLVDWELAKEEVCSRLDHLMLNGGDIKVAWYGESSQAKEVFSEIIERYKHKGIEWVRIVNDLDHIDGQFPVQAILLNDWNSAEFTLTVNMVRICPEAFRSLERSDGNKLLSPFSDESCQIRAWNVNNENATSFVKKILKESENNKVVVFIALRHGNFPSIEHIAKGLAQFSGIKTYGVYLESDIPCGVYEDVFSCEYSLGVLAELVNQLPPMTVYLQAHASWAYLGQFIRAVNAQLKIIQEVYDWMGAFIADEALVSQEGVFSLEQISLIRQSENYISNHSDGYLYKDDGPWMKRRVRDSRSPSLKVYPCPPSAYLKKPTKPVDDGAVKLVYAGQISHGSQSKKIFGDMYYIPVIKDLTKQGFHVTVYNAVHHTRRHPVELYREYLDESKNSQLFDFKKGIPMPDILDELQGKYDYGLIAYYFEDDLHVGEDHLKGTMASKLFTYLAAGIPVIVSKQFEYMANIVENDGVGIVVSRDDMKNLSSLLASLDYSKLLRNVQSAQKKYAIDSQLPAIVDFLER